MGGALCLFSKYVLNAHSVPRPCSGPWRFSGTRPTVSVFPWSLDLSAGNSQECELPGGQEALLIVFTAVTPSSGKSTLLMVDAH